MPARLPRPPKPARRPPQSAGPEPEPARLAYFQPVAASSRFSNMGIMVWTYVLVRWLSSL